MKCVWWLSIRNLTPKADLSQAEAFKSLEHPLVIVDFVTLLKNDQFSWFDKHKRFGDYEMPYVKQKSELSFIHRSGESNIC